MSALSPLHHFFQSVDGINKARPNHWWSVSLSVLAFPEPSLEWT